MNKITTFWGKEVRYTINMVFATAEKAQEPKSKSVKIAAWIYAALLVTMVVGQLIAVENFIPLINSTYVASHSNGAASLASGLIVFAEIFALPALLRMTLSPLMRLVSQFFGIFVPFFWATTVTFFPAPGVTIGANSGLFGTHVPFPLGAVATIFSLLLLALGFYSVTGLATIRKK